MAVVAALLLLGNTAGRFVHDKFAFFDGPRGPEFYSLTDLEHGWPWTFLSGRPASRKTVGAQPGVVRFSRWRIAEGAARFQLVPLLGNLMIAILVMPAAAWLFECRRRRRHSIWQFNLTDLFGLMTLLCLVMGYYAVHRVRHQTELAILRQLDEEEVRKVGESPTSEWADWDDVAPAWLRGDDDKSFLDVFVQVVAIDVDDEQLEQVVGLRGIRSLSIWGRLSGRQLKLLEGLDELQALNLAYASSEPTEDFEPVDPEAEEDCSLTLPPLPKLRGLNLYHAWFSGDGLEHLERIEVLGLSYTEVDDDAMKKLADLRHLRSLSLDGTTVSDDGLRHLAHLTTLEALWLWETPTGDKGLQHLAGLSNLRELRTGPNVTDTSVSLLGKLRKLEHLDLRDTGMTADGVARLKEVLPNCRIDWSPGQPTD
jgi:hypothetical protein